MNRKSYNLEPGVTQQCSLCALVLVKGGGQLSMLTFEERLTEVYTHINQEP